MTKKENDIQHVLCLLWLFRPDQKIASGISSALHFTSQFALAPQVHHTLQKVIPVVLIPFLVLRKVLLNYVCFIRLRMWFRAR